MELVSIIVRTCNRPDVLRKNLESLRKQSYRHIEVIIVEDGMNMSQRMLEEEFSDLSIKYAYTGEKKGRTVVGNMALAMADGKYINFLDDDDLFFPDHVEILVDALNHSAELVAYSVAYESISAYNSNKKEFEEKKRKIRYRQPFNRSYLYYNNYIPIQTVMFDRSLYEELGGFDESLDFLEDWDLWVRYSTKTDFKFIDRITSLYRVPIKKKKRSQDMYNAYDIAVEKFMQYNLQMNVNEISNDLKYVLEEIKTPGWKKFLKKVMQKVGLIS